MDKQHLLRTGDAVMFSGNTPTGFLLRTFVSSQWNHSGIAVRFVNKYVNGKYIKEISLTEEGDLYILETNTGYRFDDIQEETIVGVGFSRADWVFRKYNKIAFRSLHDIFRTSDLAEKTMDFLKLYKGNQFPSGSSPFLSVWLGIRLQEKEDSEGMFCSEAMAHYYMYCLKDMYEKITKRPFDNKLSSLFGSNCPSTEDMFQPGHYSYRLTPKASIFSGPEEIIYVAYADLLYIILQPLIIVLFVVLLLWMSLSHM